MNGRKQKRVYWAVFGVTFAVLSTTLLLLSAFGALHLSGARWLAAVLALAWGISAALSLVVRRCLDRSLDSVRHETFQRVAPAGRTASTKSIAVGSSRWRFALVGTFPGWLALSAIAVVRADPAFGYAAAASLGLLSMACWWRVVTNAGDIAEVSDAGIAQRSLLQRSSPPVPWEKIARCSVVSSPDMSGGTTATTCFIEDAEGQELLRLDLGTASPRDQQRFIQVVRAQCGQRAELEAAPPPAGRGVELESAGAGRGVELEAVPPERAGGREPG